MNQYSKNTDAKLNGLSHEIGEATDQIEKATENKDKAWEEVVALFGEFAQDQKSPKFIADDGHSLVYIKREGKPRLDEAMLQAILFQRMDKREATKIWNSITKRVIDPVALEAAVRTLKIPADIVEECMTEAKDSYSRTRPEWSKEDRERARILGILKE